MARPRCKLSERVVNSLYTKPHEGGSKERSSMSFDYSGAEAWKVQDSMLPVGDHVVTISDPMTGQSSGGYPQIELRVENELGSLRDWLVITPAAIGKVVQVFDAAGIERPQDGEFDPQTGALEQSYVDRLHNRKVGVIVREEPDNRDPSKMRRRIMGYTDVHQITSDIPADTTGLPDVSAPSASRPADEDERVPF